MRRRLLDVPSLVQQIGAHSAANIGPALRDVAEQFRSGRAGVFAAHRTEKPRKGAKVPNAVIQDLACRDILRNWRAFRNVVSRKPLKTAVFIIWHADCY